MAVQDTTWINEKHAIGWIDEHKTVVRANAEFNCGCGELIKVQGRKSKTGSDKYEFVITHRKRTQTIRNENPTETQIFDKMVKVSSYVTCRFPLEKRWRRRY